MQHTDDSKQHSSRGKEIITSTLKYLADGLRDTDDLFSLWAGHGRQRKSMLCERSNKNTSQRRLSYLKKKNLVKEKKIRNRIFLELSEEGEKELLSRTLAERSLLPFNQVCIVMYDFPLSANKGRDAFRSFLKRAGFRKRQMSVWESDRNVLEDVQHFVNRAGAEQWVEVFLAKKQ